MPQLTGGCKAVALMAGWCRLPVGAQLAYSDAMLRPLLLFSIVALCALATVRLLWAVLRWGERPDLLTLGEVVLLLAVAGVLYRAASEAWIVRRSHRLDLSTALPEGTRLLASGLRLSLRLTVTDRQGQTSKTDFQLEQIARSGEQLWLLGQVGQQKAATGQRAHRRRRAIPVSAISFLAEKQTGQFVADNITGWLVQRSAGWADAAGSAAPTGQGAPGTHQP